MGLIAKEGGEERELAIYQMEWRLQSFYQRKADVFSIKKEEPFRDFSIPTDEEIAFLDSMVADEEVIAAQKKEEEDQASRKKEWEKEEARQRVILRASDLENSISYAQIKYGEKVEGHGEKQTYLYERARRSAENRKTYETIREQEIQNLEHIESILAKRMFETDDINALKFWMDTHREFGLAEMTDDEYFDLFSDGRFNIHSTNFFHVNTSLPEEDPRRMNDPRFFEALKDGYLMGRNIGAARGEPMSGSAHPESIVSFDSHLDLNHLRRWGTHFDYSLTAISNQNRSYCYNHDRLPPVLLVTPARLIEAHSIKEPRIFSKDDFIVPVGKKEGDISQGVGEGDAFGSGNPNAMSPDHNIDLGLFVLLLPKVAAKKELIHDMLSSISEDPRFAHTPIPRLARVASKKIPDQGVDLETFMRDVFSLAIRASEKKGIQIPTLPRLHFYEVASPQGEDIVQVDGPRIDIENGFQGFLDTHAITPSVAKGFEKDQTVQVFLPEQLRVERSRLEQAANQIRKRLRLLDEKPNTVSLFEAREHAFTLSFTREELDRIVESDSYIPDALLQLLAKDLGDEYAKSVDVPEVDSLREHTQKVLEQFEKYYADKKLPGDIPHSFFRVILALHDIGKPRAVEEGDKSRQYVYNKDMVRKILTKLDYTPEQIALGDALVGSDPIGQYMKGGGSWDSLDNLRTQAKNVGMPLMDYFSLVSAFYKVDAGSYGKDAGGTMNGLDSLFIFDHKKNEISFANDAQMHFMYLSMEIEYQAKESPL